MAGSFRAGRHVGTIYFIHLEDDGSNCGVGASGWRWAGHQFIGAAADHRVHAFNKGTRYAQ